MRNFLSLTAGLCLLTSSAFASNFYCADKDQNLQFNQETALVTVEEQTLSYKFSTLDPKGELIYSRGLNQVGFKLENGNPLETKKEYNGLCVNGVQKVNTTFKIAYNAIVTIEDMEPTTAPVVCEVTKAELEYCN